MLAAQAAGIPVLFATGRPVRWLDVIRDLPGAHPTVIASNGAALYDLGAGRAGRPDLHRPRHRPGRGATGSATVVPDVSFAFESGTRFGYEPAYPHLGGRRRQRPGHLQRPGRGDRSCARSSSRCWCRARPCAPDDLLAHGADALVGDTLTATHSQRRATTAWSRSARPE